MYQALRPTLRRRDRKPLSDFMKTTGTLIDVEHPFANQIISLSQRTVGEDEQNHNDAETSSSHSLPYRQRPSEAVIEKGKALREMTHRHDTTRQTRLHMRHFERKGAKSMKLIRQEIHREELKELRDQFGAGIADPYQLTYKVLSDAEHAEEERKAFREGKRTIPKLFERRQRKADNVSHDPPEDAGKQSPSGATLAHRRFTPEAVLSDTPAVDVVEDALQQPEDHTSSSSVATSSSTLDFLDSVRSKTKAEPSVLPRIPPEVVNPTGSNSPASPTYEPTIPSPLRKASLPGKEAWWR